MSNLYDITEQAYELASREPTADEETGEISEEAFQAYVNAIDEALGRGRARMVGYRAIIKRLKARVTEAKAEAARFTARAKAQATKQERLEEMALIHLHARRTLTGEARLVIDGYLVADIRENKRVILDEDTELAGEWYNDPKPPTVDRKRLATALKAGAEIPGARLETSESVRWGNN